MFRQEQRQAGETDGGVHGHRGAGDAIDIFVQRQVWLKSSAVELAGEGWMPNLPTAALPEYQEFGRFDFFAIDNESHGDQFFLANVL